MYNSKKFKKRSLYSSNIFNQNKNQQSVNIFASLYLAYPIQKKRKPRRKIDQYKNKHRNGLSTLNQKGSGHLPEIDFPEDNLLHGHPDNGNDHAENQYGDLMDNIDDRQLGDLIDSIDDTDDNNPLDDSVNDTDIGLDDLIDNTDDDNDEPGDLIDGTDGVDDIDLGDLTDNSVDDNVGNADDIDLGDLTDNSVDDNVGNADDIDLGDLTDNSVDDNVGNADDIDLGDLTDVSDNNDDNVSEIDSDEQTDENPQQLKSVRKFYCDLCIKDSPITLTEDISHFYDATYYIIYRKGEYDIQVQVEISPNGQDFLPIDHQLISPGKSYIISVREAGYALSLNLYPLREDINNDNDEVFVDVYLYYGSIS